MKKLLPFLLLFFALPASATNRFVTESGSTSGACTAGVISRATFNGTTQSPGDVALLCGTIAGELDPQGNGALGNPITIRFDTGAKMSMTGMPTFGQFIYLAGHSFYVFDGGTPCGSPGLTCNGQIQYLNVGSAFGSTNYPMVFRVDGGAHDIEIKNLELGPLFIHTPQGGDWSGYESSVVVYGNNPGVNIHIHDNKLHDTGWTINLFGNASTSQNYEIDHNYFSHISHSVNLGTSGAVSFGGLKFHDNLVMDPSNWDQTAGSFHHDGLQITCTTTTCTVTNVQIYNNTFGGDWGCTNTSPIFFETHEPNNLVTNVTVFNNLFQNTRSPGCSPNAGWANGINALGHSGIALYNNTIICGTGGGIGLQFGGQSVDVRNNIVTSCQLLSNTGNEATTVGTLDYNLYANLISSSSGNAFAWNGTATTGANLAAQFTNWKSIVGGVAELNSRTNATANLNSSGVPQTGSVAINAGTNLTSLCGTYPALCSDKTGSARPSSGAWTMGAFNAGGGAPPVPPTGVTVTWF